MSANNSNNTTTMTSHPLLKPTDFLHLSAWGLAEIVDDNYIRLHRDWQLSPIPPANFGSWGPPQSPPREQRSGVSPGISPGTSSTSAQQTDHFVTLPRYMGSQHWYIYLGFTPAAASRLSRRFHSIAGDDVRPTTAYGIAYSHIQHFKAAGLDLDDGISAQNRDHLFRLSLLIGFSEEVRRYLCDFPPTPDPSAADIGTETAQDAGGSGMYDDDDTVLDWLLAWVYTRDRLLQQVHLYSGLREEWLATAQRLREAQADAEAERARRAKRRNDLMRRNMREVQEGRQRRRQRLRAVSSPQDREDVLSDSGDSEGSAGF